MFSLAWRGAAGPATETGKPDSRALRSSTCLQHCSRALLAGAACGRCLRALLAGNCLRATACGQLLAGNCLRATACGRCLQALRGQLLSSTAPISCFQHRVVAAWSFTGGAFGVGGVLFCRIRRWAGRRSVFPDARPCACGTIGGKGDIADAFCQARHGTRRHLRDHAHDADDVVQEGGAQQGQAPWPTAGSLAVAASRLARGESWDDGRGCGRRLVWRAVPPHRSRRAPRLAAPRSARVAARPRRWPCGTPPAPVALRHPRWSTCGTLPPLAPRHPRTTQPTAPRAARQQCRLTPVA
jgi:hypothetical protein